MLCKYCMKMPIICLVSLLGLFASAYAKEPTILFLGPNGVRPLNGYNQNYGAGASLSSMSNNGGMFSGFPAALTSALNSFRDRDTETSSSNFIFRLGERFQERNAKQKG